MKVKVSDLVRDFLEDMGVGHVFLLSGGMMIHLVDSVSRSRTIRYICNHHEQASVMAAEAYARESGRLGVCFATSGPGATNTVTGIAGAWLDSSPVLVITGQSRKTLTVRGVGLPGLRMVGNFEVDIVEIVNSITKYSVFVEDPQSILFHLQKACHLALTGRPGPVLLDIPLDVQGALVEESELVGFTAPSEPQSQPDVNPVPLLARLRNAERPLILAGHGVRVSGQAGVFHDLVQKLGIPVITTQLANDLMPYDNEFYVGHVGLRGDRAGNYAVQTCDFLLVLGSSLHVTTTGYELEHFAPSAFKAIVDVDELQLKRNHVGASLLIHSDLGSFLPRLLLDLKEERLSEPQQEWRKKCQQWKRCFSVADEPHVAGVDTINTYKLVDVLSDALKGTETIVTDAGSLYYIMGQAFRVKGDQRFIVSGAFGAMGYALPASLGAALASPAKTIVCITGDGSLQTNVQELATLAYHQLNCKIIVINNAGYASIRNSQKSFCDGHLAGSSLSTGLCFPNWRKIAEAYGVPYAMANRVDELPGLFASLLSSPGPVLCEVVIPETVQMLPAVTSEKLPNGSFRSNKLHEMSPPLSMERLLEAGIPQQYLPEHA